ncbi:hypothetical protein MMC24_006447 [Lignoscripta atroalba]|nr:hypothetical protein [Lignoscripta atroalba]
MAAGTPSLSHPAPFRLLDLSAELRLHIYKLALRSPNKTILMPYTFNPKQSHHRHGLAINLLRTCSQVHREASDILYKSNTVLVGADVHMTTYPVINAKVLPQCALSRLRHVFVVLDACDGFQANYKNVDFRQFQAMTALQTLRIGIVTQRDSIWWTDSWATLLAHVIERVPSQCAVEFGSFSEAEKEFMGKFIKAWSDGAFYSAHEVSGDVLREIAKELGIVKGSKSGSDRDHRPEYYNDTD